MIKNKQRESIENKNFNSLRDAENYAQSTSLHDDNHFYAIEEKTGEDEFKDIKYFQHGKMYSPW